MRVGTMLGDMAVDEVVLLPDPDQHKLLTATLERVNRTSNAARAAALQTNATSGPQLREIVKAEVDKAKLPDVLVRPVADRVEDALRRRGNKQKFSQYQARRSAPAALGPAGRPRLPQRRVRALGDRRRAQVGRRLSGRSVAIAAAATAPSPAGRRAPRSATARPGR
jgi:hypothetical protein